MPGGYARILLALIRRLGPWVVVIGILAFLFARVPITEVQAAFTRTSLWNLILYTGVGVIAILLADSFALWVAIRQTITTPKIPYSHTIQLRGASYLLTLISYGVGQGSLVYFLRRMFGVPLTTGGATILLATGAFLIVTAMTMGIGILTGQVPQASQLRPIGIAIIAIVPTYLLLIYLRPSWLTKLPVLRGLFAAGVGGTLKVGAARTVHILVLIAVHWGAMRLFGIEAPLGAALVGLPVVFVIAAIPIAPSGLGTGQAAAVALFASYAGGDTAPIREATVLAYSLSFQVLAMAIVAAIGVWCLRRLRTFDIFRKSS